MNSLSRLSNNQKGFTLMELVVALSLTGLLLLVLVSANLFIHKTLASWSQANVLVEEREFLLTELSHQIARCDKVLYDSTSYRAVFYSLKDSTVYELSEGDFVRNGTVINREGSSVSFIKISQDIFTKQDDSVILEPETQKNLHSSLYSIELSVSYKGNTDVSTKKVRNYIAFSKE
ncbi:MAG: prepilin-type N-terminal cleavage/methylation domain-containing protein [candidate division Zixibacteria bacterium]|nr:prepilin-type N-terminal cleavage/methylation domain-containing protein [candidate division Zixibacteria bacterium]